MWIYCFVVDSTDSRKVRTIHLQNLTQNNRFLNSLALVVDEVIVIS